MNQKTARKLERELEQTIAEVVIDRNKNWKYPVIPTQTATSMKKRATAVVTRVKTRVSALLNALGFG